MWWNHRIVSMGCLLAIGGLLLPAALAQNKKVAVVKTPNGGLQPQAAVDVEGNLHLLYFKGDPAAGDLFYLRRDRDSTTWSKPLKVNSQAGSAVAVGSIRGGQLAVGKKGRVHVAWNGSRNAVPKNPSKGTPVLYARLNDAGTAFEEQRNLMRKSDVLDGGCTVTAEATGRVFVSWHALATESARGEELREVWLALSTDEGKQFAPEVSILSQQTGACGCCGMRGFTDRLGHVYFLYRSARETIHRDIYLLTSADQGKTFAGKKLHDWPTRICPMSSLAFAEGPEGMYTAWDTQGQVHFARIKPGTVEVGPPVAAPGAAKGPRHPALAVNRNGEILLAWTEGTGWQKGGALAWQVFDKEGRPTTEHGRIAGAIPVWGLPAVVAEADGRFTIFH